MVSLFKSDLNSVCIFLMIEKALSESALLFGNTNHIYLLDPVQIMTWQACKVTKPYAAGDGSKEIKINVFVCNNAKQFFEE
jgi:hypothetical protein